jgi:sucrose-6F-phosphate phosphohydrolase
MNLFICTDLDQTLLPNGPEPESPGARKLFSKLCAQGDVCVAYVTGRDIELTLEAIKEYVLPKPQYIVADVGSAIYMPKEDKWFQWHDWNTYIARDWENIRRDQLPSLLENICPSLEQQEVEKQKRFKLSYYLPPATDRSLLLPPITKKLANHNILANLIWSEDTHTNQILLDVLPKSAGKYQALEFIIQKNGYQMEKTVFSGDSGNDISVFASPIPSTIVNNATKEVKELARNLATKNGVENKLYLAKGGYQGMNGNYAAGIMEGILHYHPKISTLLTP